MPYKIIHKWMRTSVMIGMVVLLSLFTACSGGSSDSSGSADAQTGDVTIGLTDAAGDFTTYTVDIVSLTLSKANGALVETLPLTTRVDFTQYVDLTEFFMASTIPGGAYDTITMTLDYRNADIRVEDADGNIVPVTTIQDASGNPITTLKVNLVLDDNHALVVAPGIPANLVLDFNLDTSNSVEFAQDQTPVLTVEPSLAADINPQVPKMNRLRGLLQDVTVADSDFDVIIRPFCHQFSNHLPQFGSLKVVTDDNTTFNINGQTYKGAEGLNTLNGLTTYTAVVAKGNLKFAPYGFHATEVWAGSTVPGGTLDAVTGNVINRAGNTLTIKGASLQRSNGSAMFNDEVAVLVGDVTKVSHEFSSLSYSANDISIGQRITVFGDLTTASNPLTLDATNGSAIMVLTTIRGDVVSADSVSAAEAPLVVNLQSVDDRKMDIFNFAAISIDPHNYRVNTSGLDISSLVPGSKVRILGFAAPINANPPDFYAHTIIDVSDVKCVLHVVWNPGSADALENISTQGLTFNLAGAGMMHHVNCGGVFTDLTTLSESPRIIAENDGAGIFSIYQHGPMRVYTKFSDFINDLSARMEAGADVKKIDAVGAFNDNAATMTADDINVFLN